MSVFKDLIPESLQRKGSPFLHHIDLEPDSSSAPGILAGWALENRTGLPVVVQFDGDAVLEVPPLFPRHDVQAKFEGLQAPLFSGFEIRLPLSELNQIGPERLKVFAKTTKGLVEIWCWKGAQRHRSSSFGADDLRRELERLNKAVTPKEHHEDPAPALVHVVLETSGLAASLMKALDQIDQTLLNREPRAWFAKHS